MKSPFARISSIVSLALLMMPLHIVLAEPDALQQLLESEQVYRQQGAEAALPGFEHLRTKFEKSGDVNSAGTAIRFIGEIHWRLGDFEKADQYLQQALSMKQAGGDSLQEGKILNVLGLLSWDLGDYATAIEYFRQGTTIASKLGDNKLEGAILNNLSLVYDEMGDYHVSLEQYQRVLELYQGADFPRGKGDTLGNIGGVYLMLGRFAEALSYYKKALVISGQLQSIAAMSQDHGNIALSYLGLGRTSLALQQFEEAIELAGQAGMQQDVAYWQRGNATALTRIGKYDLALTNYREALRIYHQVGAPAEMLETMHDLGRLYLLLGDSASAESSFKEAMKKAREIGLSRGITSNLLALGDIQTRYQAWEKAEEYYQQAMDRSLESGEMSWLSQSLLRLSGIHQQQGKLELATDEAQQALVIARKSGAQPGVVAALYTLAELQRLNPASTSTPGMVLGAYEATEKASLEILDPDLLWRIHHGKGLALDAFGDKQAAIRELLKAVNLIEGVRDRLEEQRFRAGYVQDKYQVYVDLIRLQTEAGRQEEAFSTAERLRARSFVELVENNAHLGDGDETGQAETQFQERIRHLRTVLTEEQARERPEQRQIAIKVYSSELIAAEREYQLYLDDRQKGRPAAEHWAHVPTFAEVKGKLGAEDAVIEYVVGDDSVMTFILTREALLTETISMTRQDLASRIELLRDLIHKPGNDRWTMPADSLADMLIKPIEKRGLLDGKNHLYLIPHGSLNYLPFALLPAGNPGSGKLLIDDFTLTYLPTAAVLVREPRQQPVPGSLLAMAPSRSLLKYASAEANSISEIFKPESNLFLGASATETIFKQLSGNFSILHLSTHGYFNKLNPLLSGLELEQDSDNDGQLELYEILELNLNADLVTLSACQTALGSGYFSEIPAGDDFVSLTRAFIYAGSQSVMATLWMVDDRSTMHLMQKFYSQLKDLKEYETQAVALALAQREMRSGKEYRHPYYWAPFVLVGEMSRGSFNQSL